MADMAKARIAYNGPALEQGMMDVKALAPALLAFADLVNYANIAIGGERKVQVMLNQDSLRKGSFDITTILNYSLLDQAKLFMTAADDLGLSALMEILGWGATTAGTVCGIFSLIKKIGGRKIKEAEAMEGALTKIVLVDETIIMTKNNTMKVYLDGDCRQAIEKVIQPLQRDGVESFELRDPDASDSKAALESITKVEAEHFKAPPLKGEEQIESSPEQEITVKITSLSFSEGQKWRLTDGNNTFWAKIEDDEFLAKVDSRELSFRSGDMLRIRYYIRQTVKNDSLSSEYIVTKVIELKSQPKQIQLDFDMK